MKVGSRNTRLPSFIMDKKQCITCLEVKALSAFRKAKTNKYWEGYRNTCKQCEVQRQSLRDVKLSWEDYIKLLADQNNVCAICGEDETAKRKSRLSIDHNHTTGKVRGLLCARCNVVIGLLQDNPTLCPSIQAYLERHNQ